MAAPHPIVRHDSVMLGVDGGDPGLAAVLLFIGSRPDAQDPWSIIMLFYLCFFSYSIELLR